MTGDPHISLLASITWLSDLDPPPEPAVADWLLERGSMTRRFERHCQRVSIRRGREGYFPAQALGEDEVALLPPCERYWLREIILCGDDRPWLAGRTLMPENAMDGAEWALTTLGDMPLGRWLFRDRAPERDFIQLGRTAGLWARRSCLRPNGKPLLLTELFLPDAPLYC
ncbi:chorismate lyase [Acerihabitans arboris]|uniref:Chorismate pyruvate-lyase n=1 Tax=Acerihabitans arboris TaxID=2691583 RepID=A0A845SQJ7_9GAMM|nr:chorismate lyase [Acerihabitans arboris]NDL65176.1 chorismate lyase [Acerihabitans arboris]